MIFHGLMFLLLLLSMIVQEFLPFIHFEAGMTFEAMILLPWVVFYVLALAVPYPVLVGFAFVAGFMFDARHQVPVGDFAFGTTIVLFVILGSLVHGVRPLFRRGNWIAPVVMVGVAVLLQLAFEYLLMSFRRGEIFISTEIWLKMILTSLVTVVLTPFLLALITQIAKRCGYQLEIEQFMFRKSSYGYPL